MSAMSFSSEAMGLMLAFTGMAALLGLVFGLVAFFKANAVQADASRVLLAANLIEPGLTIGLLLLGLATQNANRGVVLVLPAISISTLLLAPWFYWPQTASLNSLLPHLRFWGTLRWSYTVLLWVVAFNADAVSQRFGETAMPMIAVGVLILCASVFFLWMLFLQVSAAAGNTTPEPV